MTCVHDWILVESRTFVDPPIDGFVVTERYCRRCGQYAAPKTGPTEDATT